MGSITTNDGVKLCFSRTGPTATSTSSPVVLIHGWSGSRRYFDLSLESIGAAGVPVFAYDLRGHGDSDKPNWGAHVARLAADLRDFLVALDLSNVTCVGTSLGCAVIWSYIELFGQSDRVSKCVFVDQAPLQYRFAGDWELGSNGIYDAATLAGVQAALLKDMDAMADGIAAGCMQRPPSQEIKALLKAETLKADPAFLGALMADHTQLDWRPLLPRIELPCLVMVGKKSQCFPWQGVQYVADNIPGAAAVAFEEGDHWLYIEEAQRFTDLVVEFAKDHASVLGKQQANGNAA